MKKIILGIIIGIIFSGMLVMCLLSFPYIKDKYFTGHSQNSPTTEKKKETRKEVNKTTNQSQTQIDKDNLNTKQKLRILDLSKNVLNDYSSLLNTVTELMRSNSLFSSVGVSDIEVAKSPLDADIKSFYMVIPYESNKELYNDFAIVVDAIQQYETELQNAGYSQSIDDLNQVMTK